MNVLTKTLPCPVLNLDKCQVRRERNHQDAKGLHHGGNVNQHSSARFFCSLTSNTGCFYTLITMCSFNKQVIVTGCLTFLQKIRNNKMVFKLLLCRSFFCYYHLLLFFCLCSAVQSIHCSPSGTLTACFTDQWPPLCSVSGMIKRS